MKVLLAIDQGTTGTTAVLMSPDQRTIGRCTVEFPQYFPKPGWVEHDLEEIWVSVLRSIEGAILASQVKATDIAAIGITNQRETTAIWERSSGRAVHKAIVWQCRRTADVCESMKREGHSRDVFERTGLPIDAYFSATKINWILDHVVGARARAERGELCFGTIDSYLVYRLTGGARHVTDASNASRTLLMDLHAVAWSPDMLALFRVPAQLLPTIIGNCDNAGTTASVKVVPDGVPICGMAGDQQAALFGQACFTTGNAKCTYGTGAFALINIGQTPVLSSHNLVTTVAWKLNDGVTYALEGSAFVAGAAVQWLRDALGIIKQASDIDALARTVESSDGVFFVPALAGLGAPYWDPGARGTISGITRGTTAGHIARATLEGIAFEVDDLLRCMALDGGMAISPLRVDGGACRSDLLMQFQADLSSTPVERPEDVESTARGAAMLAGVGCGMLSQNEITRDLPRLTTFTPRSEGPAVSLLRDGWHDAIRRARSAHP